MVSSAPATLAPDGRTSRLSYRATPAAQAAIDRLVRGEDLQFSPNGSQLAIADLISNRLLILETGIDRNAAQPDIQVTDFLEITGWFDAPHGLCWLDEGVLAVANRGGTVVLVELPAIRPDSRRAHLEPVSWHGEERAHLLSAPGSLSNRALGLDLVELLVCNNVSNQISRHLLDRRQGYEFLMSEALLGQGLDLPDGIAHSPSGAWVAISNHNAHEVCVYDNRDDLNLASKPRGVLRGVLYPHGVRFSADEGWLVAADSGSPFVYLFDRGDDWAGAREPAAAIRVMSDDAFRRGNISTREGGPKGIDLAGPILAMTAENAPLAFFDLGEIVGASAEVPACGQPPADAESAREALLRYLRASQAGVSLATSGIIQAAERDVAALKSSRSWRVTAPLRRLNAVYTAWANRRRWKRARPPGGERP